MNSLVPALMYLIVSVPTSHSRGQFCLWGPSNWRHPECTCTLGLHFYY